MYGKEAALHGHYILQRVYSRFFSFGVLGVYVENDIIISQRIIQYPSWIERNFDANGSPCDEDAEVPEVPVVVIKAVLSKPIEYISIKASWKTL